MSWFSKQKKEEVKEAQVVHTQLTETELSAKNYVLSLAPNANCNGPVKIYWPGSRRTHTLDCNSFSVRKSSRR